MPLIGRKQNTAQQEDKTVEINAQMEGSLVFNDPVSLKINGRFNGNLTTKGTLTIGNSAQVQANIKGDNIVIAGKVTGDVTATKMVVLMPTAVLHGNIKTPKLNIVEGAIFQGQCEMEYDNSDLLDIEQVSKYLEIDLKEIEDLVNSGKIPGTKLGNAWRFEREKIDHWAAGGRVK